MSLHRVCPRHVRLVQRRRRVQWCGSMGGVHLPRDMESVFVVLLCRCFCLRDCWWLSVVAVLLSVGVWAPLCLSCLFGCCRLPSLPIVASLPPAVGPVWRPGPVCTLVPPSGYLAAFCDGLVALLYCWECGCALSSLLHVVSWQQRPLALCGVVFPLHHDACVVGVLSITTLRYSSMMIQVPHWTPLSFTIAILKQ